MSPPFFPIDIFDWFWWAQPIILIVGFMLWETYKRKRKR